MTQSERSEKRPYLAPAPTNLPWLQKDETKLGIEKSLEWNNKTFEDIKKVMSDWKLSFSWNWWAIWPIWIVWEVRTLNKDELIEVSHRLKNAIENRDQKHDTDIYSQIANAIEETLLSLWIEYKIESITYPCWWHNKSIEIPMPIE